MIIARPARGLSPRAGACIARCIAVWMAALAVSSPAAGQTGDLCADPAGHCAGSVSSLCLESLGAGALAAPGAGDGACGAQFQAYRGCLAEVAARCDGGASSAGGGAGCDAETARQLWSTAERNDDCGTYAAFLEACPDRPQAVFAKAGRARLACDAPGGPRPATAPTPAAPTPSAPAAADQAALAPFIGRWVGAGETTQPCPGGNPLEALLGGKVEQPEICYDIAATPDGPRLKIGIAFPGLGGLAGGAAGCSPEKALPARIEGDRLLYNDVGGGSVVRRSGDGLLVEVTGRCVGDPSNQERVIYRMRRAR